MSAELRVVSGNLQHWIRAGGEMIDGKKRTEADFRSKLAWAKFVLGTNKPDIVGMQEVYDNTVEEVFAGANYKFYYSGGAPQQVALATRLETAPGPDAITMIQELPTPIEINREGLTMRVSKLSRPILRARLVHEGDVVTVFVAHLKSKLPSYGDDPQQTYPEEELKTADFAARPLGNLVSLARRGAEAAALRREILAEMNAFPERPIIVCGDLNDDAGAVTTEMVLGDPMTTFIENKQNYSADELALIYRRLHQFSMTSTQQLQLKDSALGQVYTAIHEGRYSTLDHVFLSRHFFRKPSVVKDDAFRQRYFFNYYEVANDHLVDRDSGFAPRKPMTSDHGIVFVYCKKAQDAQPPSPGNANQPSDLEIV